MKLSNSFLLVVLVIISNYAAHAAEVKTTNKLENAPSSDDETFDNQLPSAKSEDSPQNSLRGILFNFQSRKRGAGLTCNRYPRVCRARGSAGPDCCKTKCVNVERDRNNCGMCGNKCKYSKICCNGRCVNPMFNRKHCGGCNNECSKGSLCAYGMCDYA